MLVVHLIQCFYSTSLPIKLCFVLDSLLFLLKGFLSGYTGEERTTHVVQTDMLSVTLISRAIPCKSMNLLWNKWVWRNAENVTTVHWKLSSLVSNTRPLTGALLGFCHTSGFVFHYFSKKRHGTKAGFFVCLWLAFIQILWISFLAVVVSMDVYLLNTRPVQVRMWQSTEVLLEIICGLVWVFFPFSC